MYVKVRGADDTARWMTRVSKRLKEKRQEILLQSAELIREEIARRAPKRSGRLAASISTEKSGKGVRIFPKRTHYYAPTVEFGGVHTAKGPRPGGRLRERGLMGWKERGRWIVAKRVRIGARPFFYPGFESVKTDFYRKVEHEIDKLIKLTR